MLTAAPDMNDDYNAPPTPPRSRTAAAAWLWWAVPLAIGFAGFAAVHPFDRLIFDAARRLETALSGDLKREWQAWQQYGQGVCIGFSALLIWMLAPGRRRRLLDLGLAVAVAQVAATLGKMAVGRPRPRDSLLDAASFPGPWGAYPLPRNGGWELASGWTGGVDLWSMPSSHAMFAAMFSAFVGVLWPRAAWLLVLATAVVGAGRVVFGAHWPSDVVVGWAAGAAIGLAVTRNGLGVRLLDWIWIRFIDRSAQPMWPRIRDGVASTGRLRW